MAFFKFLYRSSKGHFLLAEISGLIAGVIVSGLLALVHKHLAGLDWSISKSLTVLAVMIAGYAVFFLIADYSLVRLSQVTLLKLRLHLSRQMLDMKLTDLETAGQHRLMTTLTQDIDRIGEGVIDLPKNLVNLSIVIGCCGYLAWLSWPSFLIFFSTYGIGMITYGIPVTKARRNLNRARTAWDSVFFHLKGLIFGTKELMINREKAGSFLDDHLHTASKSFMEKNVIANMLINASKRWGELYFFLLINLLVILIPVYLHVDKSVLSGFVITCLFLVGAVDSLLLYLGSDLSKIKVAINNIQSLGFSMDYTDVAKKPSTVSKLNTLEKNKLVLSNIIYRYSRSDEPRAFHVGPISLTFESGQVSFIAGGNGSGKTTIAKLISGLYAPDSGEITWNGVSIWPDSIEDYRQNISAVFSDFYLFDHLMGIDVASQASKIDNYLNKLDLTHKVSVKSGRFTTTNLSTGQRKRLALLCAYLEDRPVYIFDEWAADQDPEFKEIFYEDLLPDLKSKNKMVIVISHDDRYFCKADVLYKLESGKKNFEKAFSN